MNKEEIKNGEGKCPECGGAWEFIPASLNWHPNHKKIAKEENKVLLSTQFRCRLNLGFRTKWERIF